ncbi:MAG: 5-oxoprolinase subunit PxpB [Planctomycetota bacterium]
MPESVVSVEPMGDSALIVRWSLRDDEVAERIRCASEALKQGLPVDQYATVPAFDTLTVHFDPTQVHVTDATRRVQFVLSSTSTMREVLPRVVEIPVCYDTSLAPDLEHVAERCGVSTADVVRLHTEASYTVRMIGFSPGFPYLSGLPPAIHCPRRETPRMTVPAGSVAIGGPQTGIYPQATPGGWNVIGRTPVRLFAPARLEPCLLTAGDRVRFTQIERSAFDNFSDAAE